MKIFFATGAAALAMIVAPIAASAGPAPISVPVSATPPTTRYSTADTDLGTLLDDPASKAIILKWIPEFASAEAQSDLVLARSMTLRSIQQFKPEVLTDARLDAIDADLAKLSAKLAS